MEYVMLGLLAVLVFLGALRVYNEYRQFPYVVKLDKKLTLSRETLNMAEKGLLWEFMETTSIYPSRMPNNKWTVDTFFCGVGGEELQEAFYTFTMAHQDGWNTAAEALTAAQEVFNKYAAKRSSLGCGSQSEESVPRTN